MSKLAGPEGVCRGVEAFVQGAGRGVSLGVGMGVGESACKWLRQCACLWHICVPNTRKRSCKEVYIQRKGCAARDGTDEWGREGMVRYGEKQVQWLRS